MNAFRLGIAVDDLGLGPKEGLQQAVRMGYGAVELDASKGEVDPTNLSQSGMRHLRKLVDSLGLELAVLGGPAGAGGFTNPATADARIDKARRILELAARLRVPVVTAYVGSLPDDPKDRRYQLVAEALDHLGEFADKTGTALAIRTSDDSPAALRALLAGLNCPTLRVCYDPGSLLIHGHDPIAGVGELAGQIAASHLRDAVAGSKAAAGREVRMGSGQVDVLAYLAALEEGHYAGPQILRRTDSADPVGDLAAAKAYLDRLLR